MNRHLFATASVVALFMASILLSVVLMWVLTIAVINLIEMAGFQ